MVIAGGAKGDVGEPERQRRPEIGADLVFPAVGEHGREIAGRAAVEQQRQDQPEAAWTSTTIQTTSRGRARISSTIREVKRMKRPNARAERACPHDV